MKQCKIRLFKYLVIKLIYYTNTKSKRIIKNILASEIYSIIFGINIRSYILSILQIIIIDLNFSEILLIVYTDLYWLYKYLIKLETTKEKRPIIDIKVLKRLYKEREFIEIQ